MDYGDADKILTLFTLEYGKISGVARHAKRSRKRFGGVLEPFAWLRLQLILKEGLSTLHEAAPVNIFSRIRMDLPKIANAAYACELTEKMIAEREETPRLFRLLVAYLEHLDALQSDESDRRFFEANLLKVLGYQPELARCAHCNADLSKTSQLYFSSSFTGILCGGCGKTGLPISSETVSMLAKSLTTGKFGVIRFSSQEVREAGAILDAAIAFHLARPLKSLAFMKEVSGLSC